MTVRAILRSWWLIVLVTASALLGAMLVTSATVPLYQARGTYVIGPADSLDKPEAIVRSFDSLQGQGIVPTLVELLSSRSLAADVSERLRLPGGEVERYEVRANVLSSSNTIELTVVGPDARNVSGLAAGIGEEASELFEDLYSVYQIVPLDVPDAPKEPFSPNPERNLLLGGLLGLTAGAGLAALRERYGPARTNRRAGDRGDGPHRRGAPGQDPMEGGDEPSPVVPKASRSTTLLSSTTRR